MLALKIKKLLGMALVLAFIAIIVFPAINIRLGSGELSESENRNLAPFPQFVEDGRIIPQKAEFESWFNDHIGLRPGFIKITADTNLNLFNRSPNSKVVKGVDGWYFYTGDNNLEIALGTYNRLDAETLEMIKNSQLELKEWLAGKGIEYVLVLPVSKVSIYPEKLLPGLGVIRTPVDILADYLEENTDIKVVRLKENLLEGKERGDVFFKTDTHWNERGAYSAYKKVIEDMNRWGITNTSPIEVSWFHGEKNGEFSAMMGGVDVLSPENYDKYSYSAKAVRQEFVSDDIDAVIDDFNFYRYTLFRNSSSNGGKSVIYGDSMFDLLPIPDILAEHFSETTFFYYKHPVNMITPEQIEILRPDIVIMEITERFIFLLSDGFSMSIPLENPNASVSSKDMPELIEPDIPYCFSITVENRGAQAWTESGRKVRLGYLETDGTDRGFRCTLPDQVEILPGESYTFEIEDFVYNGSDNLISFQMLEEGITWFGDKLDVAVS
jgi:hypothetical protein